MRPALFSLACLTGLFALGNGPCGKTDLAPAAMVKPVSMPTVRPVESSMPTQTCGCTCADCTCAIGTNSVARKALPATQPSIPITIAKAPSGYICGPSGCYPAPQGTQSPYRGSACAGGNCATVGRSYGRPQGSGWYPVKRLGGFFRRGRR